MQNNARQKFHRISIDLGLIVFYTHLDKKQSLTWYRDTEKAIRCTSCIYGMIVWA